MAEPPVSPVDPFSPDNFRDPLGTDSSPESPYHTLGYKPHQAAPGREVNLRLTSIEQNASQVVGAITLFAGEIEPDENWMFCHGQEISRTEFPELWDTIGDKYGIPSSSNTFYLPNFLAVFPLGADGIFYPLGANGGDRTQTIQPYNLPRHRHSFSTGFNFQHNDNTADGGTANRLNSINGTPSSAGTSESVELSGNTSYEGEVTPDPISTLPPYLAIHFLIRVKPTKLYR